MSHEITNSGSRQVYEFDEFEFDPRAMELYHRGEIVDLSGIKMMRVLAVFLRHPNRLVSFDEVLNEVWGDGNSDVTPDNVNQYVSQLRKVLARFEPDRAYFTNKRGRGYVFKADVTTRGVDIQPSPLHNAPSNPPTYAAAAEHHPASRFSKPKYFAAVVAIILLGGLGFWLFPSQDDDEDIREVVKDSQIYESLVLYKAPEHFKEEDLDKYWTHEMDEHSNYDRRRIRDAVRKLVDEGRLYGDETRCEQFDFQSVEISTDDQAVVKTLEKWFISVYFKDGTLQRNKYVGPYFVSYVLRKVDGRWLIEKSTTARVQRPRPILEHVEATSAIAGEQFFVNVTGQDLEPETFYLQVTGPGCPETKPCKVPNSALMDHSKLSATAIENIPLTLAAGDFQLVGRNADSSPSNPISITVP